ncbi:pyruvate dehydrogenase [acetyl-transferring]-phosphatase 1, mitochondrial [Brienomyrus brachyistius]|uniref:pyruvate dehydrogenase [acetyl-transferring]-phosphatase 1, mitochondrial n=1 Tax=Brienomyrus brachyistius TaxID=42636 RepID=UPI0020B1F094|nr:pyruvate dehydrogenase [acetyl-transferring]-phosphatase 1, mitochondrial [Brienomyrus brachyistius]XP_048880042.1 pyruvate dehydrogenase [acetyl-transferring]-phosphatase 1, mitochondrial [Brienomyrus brachyistius]
MHKWKSVNPHGFSQLFLCCDLNRLWRFIGLSVCKGVCRPSINQNRKYRADSQTNQTSFPQINHFFTCNEYSYKVNGYEGRSNSPVLGFDSNLLPSNSPPEDRWSAATCLQSRGMLFGVFDGHGGYACAQAVSERLFYYIAMSLLPLKTLVDIEDAVEKDRPVIPILQWHKHPSDHPSIGSNAGKRYFNSLRSYWQELIDLGGDEGRDIQNALVKAFRRLDNDISLEAQADFGEDFSCYAPIRVALSGCTACIAHLDGTHLYVANLGDSRAMIGLQENNGMWSALTISNDHNAKNPMEVRRLHSEHPRSEKATVVRHDRLLGRLTPFRAFGNVKFKWNSELLMHVCERRQEMLPGNDIASMFPPEAHTPPYLIAEPEVTYHRVRPQDKFLVLATDGLWELMHRQNVVQVLGEHLTGIHWQKPISGLSLTLGQMQTLLTERRTRALSALEDANSATHLIRHALGGDGFGTVDTEYLFRMLNLPQDLVRMYRDDITVTVIHLNQPGLEANCNGSKRIMNLT